jgi:hypothetical protein
MRLRQGVLVAEDLDRAVAVLRDTLGAGAPFHDPGVAAFGLTNAVLPIGDTFLEVVSPVSQDAAAARYRTRHGGDGGYMVMVQSDDLAMDRARIENLGIRIVWSAKLDEIAGLHLHPKDTGGALLSLDQPRDPGAWLWAGPDWESRSGTHVASGLAAVELASPDPEQLARRWAEILDRPVEGDTLRLDEGAIHFLAGDQERLVGLEFTATDRSRAGETHDLLGVRIGLV